MIPENIPNITDREVHQVVLGDLRFRCIEYSNDRVIVLCVQHRIPELDNMGDDFDGEMSAFRKGVKAYMDGVLVERLKLDDKKVFVAQCDVYPPQFVEYWALEQGLEKGVAKRRVYPGSVAKLFEGSGV